MPLDLTDRVCLVAGATRGAGRGIAVALGERGATVWCSGRSVAGQTPEGRPETIQETAELVTAAGGQGHWFRADHTDTAQVAALIAAIDAEHGRLDVLVNDIWGGDALTHWGPFWEGELADGLRLLQLGVTTHLITAHLALPLLLRSEAGLHVEITDGSGDYYRHSLFFDLAKADTRRLALALDRELSPLGHTAVAITPGFLRSEGMLDHFGVTEATWRDGAAADPHFAWSESPRFVGRGLAALAADPNRARHGGTVLSSGVLGGLYGLSDLDGSRPDFPGRAITVLVDDLEALGAEALAEALADTESLVAAVGPMAGPFAGLIGADLLPRLRSGEPVRAAVTEILRL